MYLFLLSILPPIVLLLIVYLNDKIEKESKKLLTKLFFKGLWMTLPIAAFEIILALFIPFPKESIIYHLIDTFFIVGFLEEFGKFAITKKNTWNNKEFDYTFDDYRCARSRL